MMWGWSGSTRGTLCQAAGLRVQRVRVARMYTASLAVARLRAVKVGEDGDAGGGVVQPEDELVRLLLVPLRLDEVGDLVARRREGARVEVAAAIRLHLAHRLKPANRKKQHTDGRGLQ
eukprot:3230594-Pleurochrysis_carterae.AAC.1